ncbi:hypothetical protein Alches_14280 [Alicyclobacillus hesperidum subsp. aegles]|uniref:Ig-like domain-containing protein n=1 Tax=Alicyclobacillus hesperidum TaxID=89784 RepID=UPI00222BEC3C|nr:Ig-like domain-containing protein [Alicyclobacillus hesperidum]GLG01389.1 hypothetical protein Alches_14280 [Alicyclobacillus hesperidum subsp. aegles]
MVKRVLAGLAATSVVLGTGVPMTMAMTLPSWFQATVSVGGQTLSQPETFSFNNQTYLPVFYVDNAFTKLGYKATWNGAKHVWDLELPANLASAVASAKWSDSGNTSISINGQVVGKTATTVEADPATNNKTTYIPITVLQSIIGAVNAGSWNANQRVFDINTPNSITAVDAYNGQIVVQFANSFTVAPTGSEISITGSDGSTVTPSAAQLSSDGKTVTYTIPEITPPGPVPHYSVSYMGGKAVLGYEPVVAVNDGTPGVTSGALQVGKTLTVSGVSDQCKPMPSLTFTSDNTSVATVASDGTVTAVAPGVAHIQATDGQGFQAKVPFTVYVQGANDPTIQSVTANSNSLVVTFDQAFTAAPTADEFIVTETDGSTSTPVVVSGVSLSSDGKTVTLTLPAPSSSSSSSNSSTSSSSSSSTSSAAPQYSVSFLDHTAVSTTVAANSSASTGNTTSNSSNSSN